MFDAVMTDDPSQVNDVLKSGVDINIRGPQGYTPLFQAVLSHQLNVAHFLLEHGADATRRNNGGFNPLDAAAFGGCASCVRMLLKHGVDPTLVGRDGFNALHRAIWGDEESHTEIVEMLLEAGLSPTKMAEKPGEGMVEPINMINENERTEKLLKREHAGLTLASIPLTSQFLLAALLPSAFSAHASCTPYAHPEVAGWNSPLHRLDRQKGKGRQRGRVGDAAGEGASRGVCKGAGGIYEECRQGICEGRRLCIGGRGGRW